MKILDYEFIEGYLYDKEHNWYKKEEDTFRVGVTDFFQKTANEIVFVELPAVGRNLEAGKPFVSIESGKWVGRVINTVGGTVISANSELKDFPYLINESPYDEGWLIVMTPVDQNFTSILYDLSNAEQLKAYEEFLVAEQQRIAGMKQ